MDNIINYKDLYISRLIDKFGYNALKGEYINTIHITEHICKQCKETFLVRPVVLLNRKHPLCKKCLSKTNSCTQREDITKVKQDLLDKFGTKIQISSKSYISVNRKAKFKCTCGHIWEALVDAVLRAKHGCPICGHKIGNYKRRKTPEQYALEVKEVNKNIILLSDYTTQNELIKAKCVICNFIWTTPAYNIIGSGCPNCARLKMGIWPYSQKEVTIEDKVFKVQGYEGIALEWLCYKKGVDKNNVEVFSSGKIPSIPYTFENIDRNYYPDILIGKKNIVEVKSYRTLFVDWDRNVAKAKACIKQGYKFRLILVNIGVSYPLPLDWYKQTKEEIEGYLRSKRYNYYRIISFDPGVTNMAWSIIEIKNTHDIRVLDCGMIHNTLKVLKGNIRPQVDAFLAEIYEKIDKYECNGICLERFMSRGNKGITIELVNTMIGILIGHFCDLDFLFITAAQWKNDLNRKINLKKLYKKFNCKEHIIDSIFIGVYGAYKFLGFKPFSTLTFTKLKSTLIPSIKESIENYNSMAKPKKIKSNIIKIFDKISFPS